MAWEWGWRLAERLSRPTAANCGLGPTDSKVRYLSSGCRERAINLKTVKAIDLEALARLLSLANQVSDWGGVETIGQAALGHFCAQSEQSPGSRNGVPCLLGTLLDRSLAEQRAQVADAGNHSALALIQSGSCCWRQPDTPISTSEERDNVAHGAGENIGQRPRHLRSF